MATADLWVHNAENYCVSFFNQVIFIFHLRGGEIKKSFFLGLPIDHNNPFYLRPTKHYAAADDDDYNYTHRAL